MNEFIEITNRVIHEELKDKFKISEVDYYIMDGEITIKLTYYTNGYEKRGFYYRHCPHPNDDKSVLEMDFRCAIKNNFNI